MAKYGEVGEVMVWYGVVWSGVVFVCGRVEIGWGLRVIHADGGFF